MSLNLEKKKKIQTEVNLKRIFTPKCYVCGKQLKVHDYERIKNCKMFKRSKQKKMCIICGEYYKHLQNYISSRKHRKALLIDAGNEEIEEYESTYKSRLRSYRINNLYNVISILGFFRKEKKCCDRINKKNFRRI